jgi:ABC-type glycerol-3-phosphate transport system substrate-binding protein
MITVFPKNVFFRFLSSAKGENMRRRRMIVILIIAAALLSGGQMVFANGAKEASAAGGQTGGTLTFWNMPFVTQEVSPDYVKQWLTNAKTALPNYKVSDFFGPGDYGKQRDKFLIQSSSGSPDVIEGLLEDVAVYVQKGDIEPLDSYFNGWSEKSQFVDATLKPLTIKGKLWGIPYNTNARGLVYRKDVLDKYNLSVPKTWSDLINVAQQITKDSNKQMYGLFLCTKVGDPRAPQEFISWYYQVSGGKNMFSVTDGQKTYNATVDQLDKILTLYSKVFVGDNPAADPAERGNGWPSEDPGYTSGKWAMAPEGPWLWGRRKGDPTAQKILDNSVVTSLPIPDGGGPGTYLEVKAIMMNHYAKDKAGAWKLIKYITSKENMGNWMASSGGIPARKDSLELPVFQGPLGKWIKMFAAILPEATAQAPINWGPVSEANMRAVNYVIYGQKSPHDAAQWLHDTVSGLLKSGQI